ncbi:MAG TPA: hypothetical protein IAA44_08600 [Candidatus Blautia avistercoris]|uniref:hypothetical protein n=1 Tax=Blautia sp. An249 TaxID=1965603 RepID=UPI000B374382|nr:hypothetical protein B5F53_14950 [Blautia sp. An249]HIY19445.1 hypothetical protein [Candidatus Blautia avistercoris]
MYHDKYFPFYVAYANPMLYDGEKIQEKEYQMMKTYYPEITRRIQNHVEEECDRLDYEGSMLYDEYPDKYTLYHLCSKIHKKIEEEMPQKEMGSQERRGPDKNFMDELIQVLLCQELVRRRCRRSRRRHYF